MRKERSSALCWASGVVRRAAVAFSEIAEVGDGRQPRRANGFVNCAVVNGCAGRQLRNVVQDAQRSEYKETSDNAKHAKAKGLRTDTSRN